MARRKRDSRGRLGLFAGAAVAALLAFPGVASATVTSSVNAAGALTVTTDAADTVEITSDANGDVKINGGNPGGGAAVAASSITSIQVTGDGGNNILDLSGVSDPAFGVQTPVTVDGGGGNDVITGSKLADLLKGGEGHDRIIGDDNPLNTFDDMRGEGGDDVMVWNGGDDDDINEGGPGHDTSEVNGGGKEQFKVAPHPDPLKPGRVLFEREQPDQSFLAPFKVDISDDTERLDLNAAGGEDFISAAAGLAALQFALDIEGGDGNDVIDGSDGADQIDAGAGDDQIAADDNPLFTQDNVLGGSGNDTMTWNPGDDDDINEGGPDNDTVVVNGGGKEKFEVTPSATPGRVAFNRVQPNSTFLAPFSIDIGTSENLVLNAGDDNDVIKGSKGLAGLIDSTFNGQDGKDQIKGTDGEDLLTGGKGSDLIRSFDGAADQVECDSGFDVAFVDRRDTVRGCEIVLGGALKVKVSAKSVNVAGGVAALTLRCVATKGCSGLALLRYDGKKIAGAKFKMGKKKTQTVRLKLNKRGLRLLAKAPKKKGLKVQLRIDAKDAAKNGWRTDTRLQLKP